MDFLKETTSALKLRFDCIKETMYSKKVSELGRIIFNISNAKCTIRLKPVIKHFIDNMINKHLLWLYDSLE